MTEAAAFDDGTEGAIGDQPEPGTEDHFADLKRFLAIPRVTGLALAPDGSRLVVGVQHLSADGKKFNSSVWQVDVDGGAPLRLTRSAGSESAPAFLPDGSLLFVAKRDDPDAAKDGPAVDGAGLWVLPARGGEARLLAAPPAGVGSVAVARDRGSLVLSARMMPDAADFAEDAARRKARKDADVTAILHEISQVREWDSQVGPDQPRLFAADAPGTDGRLGLRDVSGHLGFGLESFDVTPDGATVVCSMRVERSGGDYRTDLVAVDIASGTTTVLATDETADFGEPLVSPDGRRVLCARTTHGTYELAHRTGLWLQPLDGPGHDPMPDFEHWPSAQAWSPDSAAVFFVADELGRAPVFRLDLATGAVTRLTGDRAAYSHVRVAPDGTLYALRSALDAPPRPVRLDSTTAEQEPVLLSAPGDTIALPGRLEEVVAAAPDGHPIHARLVLPELPEGAGPAPLLLFVHGGPHVSWNSWNWRWSPWIMARRGYAVLMPDPAMSTGYGQAFHDRGWSDIGGSTYTDLMAVTDAVVARPDIDETRTAALGGSFGGYMANWISTQTDRFQAVVSHAGVWNLELRATSDYPWAFRRQYDDAPGRAERWLRHSPHRYAENVATPILVIHGNRDYRVPVGNALWQWQDLRRHAKDAKFLYFPDENHWVLRPQESALWYETVLAFLAEKVLGQEWQRPELL